MAKYKLKPFTNARRIDPSRILLFNIVSGKKALISSSVFQRLLDGDCDVSLGNEKFVSDNFFINESDYNGDMRRNSLSIISHAINNADRLSLYLVVTRQCNFKCPYCYMEKNLKATGGYISKEILGYVASWINCRIEHYRHSSVTIHLYGGEPFYEPKSLIKLVEDLREKISVPTCFYTASNGYNVNRESIDRLKRLGLKRIMITLDGPPKVHDKRRLLVNSESGTFNRILQNVKDICMDIHTCVRVNIDAQNINKFAQLLSILKTEGLEKSITIDAYPVEVGCADNAHCKDFLLDSEQAKGIVDLWRLIVKEGFRLEKRIPFAAPCFYYGNHSYAIDTNGDVYPCPGMIGDKQQLCGSVVDARNYDKHVPQVWEKCIGCENVFLCSGGCRIVALSTGKEIWYRDCRKEFMSEIRKEYFYLYDYEIIKV
jgi:uncharacterized protein